MTTWTEQNKNSTTFSESSRQSERLWDDPLTTWDNSLTTWDSLQATWTEQNKNSTTFTFQSL